MIAHKVQDIWKLYLICLYDFLNIISLVAWYGNLKYIELGILIIIDFTIFITDAQDECWASGFQLR